MTVLLGLVAALLGLAVAMIVLLVLVRVTSGWREARHAREHAVTRDTLLTFVLGEDDEVDLARSRLAAMAGGEWSRTEQQIFRLLPKVAGETRARLVELVRDRGAAQRARRLVRSPSAVVRCRGAHRLGALREPADVPVLVDLLHDRRFLVRRVALRGLGSIADPGAVPAVLATCGDPALTRDVVSALQRMGVRAAPALRTELESALATGDAEDRTAEIAIIALGLIGDAGAVGLLLRALETGSEPVRAEAATALGLVGAPQAIPALLDRLGSGHDRVRRAAARALGEIGDAGAVPGLSQALETSPRLTSRALASALLRLGAPGREVLHRHRSPYAREALAVDELRAASR
ncbi:HEAT repeat domain-containing protein [Nocardioides jensenii]|uniref:HEAT repeat domain-containing protein n=1 Tax=Nocardioides jensenii TaxID=1843 RepID=UPI00082CFC55|nr:HEAT repeat domain-containing protein [Nocardioides jensenii]